MGQFIIDLKSEGADRVLLVTKENDKINNVKKRFDSYFYILSEEQKKLKKALESSNEVKNVEEVKRFLGLEEKTVLKVTAYSPEDVPDLRKDLKHFGQIFEADLPYKFRYLVDNNLFCSMMYDNDLKNCIDEKLELKMRGFDIETLAEPGMLPNSEKDPVIVMSYLGKGIEKLYDARKSEKEMLESFVKDVKQDDPDVIIGYNSSAFDFPYLKRRCKKLKIDFSIGRDNSEPQLKKTQASAKAYVFGRTHLDAYKGISFMTTLGMMNLPKNSLDAVYNEFFGKHKLDIDKSKMNEYWEDLKKLKKLIDYNREDSVAAYEIGKKILPLYIELSKITGLPVYDVANMTSGQMIEWLLIREGFRRNQLIMNRPNDKEAELRLRNPVKGAFVKQPKEGLHENIVVCDFKSLYPSIIISHNLSPETYNCECCQDEKPNPAGHIFCRKRKGIIPAVLERLIKGRAEVKKQLKKTDKNSFDYKMLDAKQLAMKLLANSTYGYLLYSKSRWYSREAGESATAFGRKYIQETIDKAEKAGFEVLYADTDSNFLLLKDKTKEDVKNFVESVNKNLPGNVELDIQKYYSRGLFVTKREGGAAKKRYALLTEDGKVEIKGFEFVRRDWSKISKETQEKVIEAVLKQGNPKKAVQIVQNAIDELKAGKIPLEDLIIYTQITRRLEEYQQQGPHVKAARMLEEGGIKISPGYILEYVVTEGSGSISDRSVPFSMLGKKKPDYNYYVSNQILPAVMKILKELGVDEEDLKYSGKQKSLSNW